jgi:hypothetical protein
VAIELVAQQELSPRKMSTHRERERGERRRWRARMLINLVSLGAAASESASQQTAGDPAERQ